MGPSFTSAIGSTYLHTIRGVVTSLCPDHGWIDDCIFFHNVAVTGNVPLRVGQQVIAVVEEEETAHRLEAIKVRLSSGRASSIFFLGLIQGATDLSSGRRVRVDAPFPWAYRFFCSDIFGDFPTYT
jgi:hypothetical protein